MDSLRAWRRARPTSRNCAARRCGSGVGRCVFRGVLYRPRGVTGESTLGGKDAERHFRIPDLLSVFPDARIICLVRDPRAVAASYRDWKRNEPSEEELEAGSADRQRIQRSYNVVLHALIWRSSIAAAVRALHAYGDGSIRLQRYEELVSEPEESLRAVAGWLDLEYDDAMLDVPVVHSSYGLQGEGASTAPIGRWQQKLPPAEIAVIQSCCRRLMNLFGYEAVEHTSGSRAWREPG